jgi:hypothetical protein
MTTGTLHVNLKQEVNYEIDYIIRNSAVARKPLTLHC